ncbi:MAG: hypothetical protein AMS20_00795 [Gemmatimonas sp. SG8_28]|nr:MAG: hypothetical protein AMS20_00795 [Gemmatimonas sp. SG8_28]
MKKLHGVKDYPDPKPRDGKWGQAESLEHWVMLMHEWAQQVNNEIHELKGKGHNPDDPPDPPWEFG